VALVGAGLGVIGSFVVGVEPQAVTRLVGRVLLHGTPVADALVTCPTGQPVHTDRAGAYACADQRPGAATMIVLDRADHSGTHWALAKIALVAGQTTTAGVELIYGALICGIAVDETGAPLPSVRIHAMEAGHDDVGDATTDTYGSFCAKYLTGGSYKITAFSADGQLQPVSPLAAVPVAIGEGRADVRVAFVAPRSSLVRTVRESSSARVADVAVRVDPPTPSRLAEPIVAVSSDALTALTVWLAATSFIVAFGFVARRR
jgi:hypothetical protein